MIPQGSGRADQLIYPRHISNRLPSARPQPIDRLIDHVAASERLKAHVNARTINFIMELEQSPERYFPHKKHLRPLEYFTEIFNRSPSHERAIVELELFQTCFEDRTSSYWIGPEPQSGRLERTGGLLIASTPRSGNTILQKILATCIELPTIGAHHFEDIRHSSLTQPAIYQIHVNPADAEAYVDQLGLSVITVVRHPLDVLVSVLHFARKSHQIEYWLDGAVLPDRNILKGLLPTDQGFVEWATSSMAGALLEVSHRWATQSEAMVVRYESLIADPAGVADAAMQLLGVDGEPNSQQLRAVLDSANRSTLNDHYWRGEAGNWRNLLLPQDARRIYEAHEEVFIDLGYAVEDTGLTRPRAIANYLSS